MLAAAHEADLAAARKADLATAFISRPLEQGPGVPGAGVATRPWDLSVSSIAELADQMGPRLRGCGNPGGAPGGLLREMLRIPGRG
jgi:2-haloacid dehalogenase